MSFLASLPPHGPARDKVLLAALAAGQIDPPVWVRLQVGRVELQVSADYLTIAGERVPMSAPVAQAAVDSLDALLPTPKIVDAIEDEATIVPLPTWAPPPGQDRSAQTSSAVLALCEERTRAAFELRRIPAGQLVAGHRKDVVLARYMPPSDVVIYGARWPSGHRLQPLYPVPGIAGHEATYEDYSHGVRAVRDACLLDGEPTTVTAILEGPEASLLGGPVARLRYASPLRPEPPIAPAPLRTLRRGDHGPDVQELQHLLGLADHRTTIDGVLGRLTEEAVKAFQEERGLEVDGVVGRATWAALRDEPPPTENAIELVVDVSQWSGVPDYHALRAKGYTGVIVRLGSGVDSSDTLAERHILAATAAGLQVETGYVYVKSWEAGPAQALHFLDLHKRFGLDLWIDVEPAKPYDGQTRAWPVHTDAPSLYRPVVVACLDVMRASGVPWGMYGALFLQALALPAWVASVPLWAATYGEGLTKPRVPKPWTAAAIWQHEGDVQVAGAKVDFNKVLAPGGMPAVRRAMRGS